MCGGGRVRALACPDIPQPCVRSLMELLWKIVSAIILALVEGITEFLPVSSTGHMILAQALLDLDVPPGHVFEIFIQFGAILSICVLYFRRRWPPTSTSPRR